MTAGAPLWLRGAIEGVERRVKSVRPPLGDRLAWMASRLARMNGGGSLETALRAPATTPGLALIEALREDMGVAPDDPRVASIGEGAILLYMYLRIQDDLVDEPDLVDRGHVYAAEVFSSASSRAFASAAAGSAAFFAFREEVMLGFAETAAFELDVVRGRAGDPSGEGEGEEDLAWLGRKLLPMAVPLGALAFAAGRSDAVPQIIEFVTAFGGVLQIVNDVLNAGEDHAGGRATPVLRWLEQGGRVGVGDGAGRVRALLLGDAALERALSHARLEAARAEAIASAMGAREVAAVARERAAFVETVPSRLLALCVGGGLR